MLPSWGVGSVTQVLARLPLPAGRGGVTITVEERRRIALHRAAAQSWGEEVANTLVELVAPSGHELATRADIRGVLEAMESMDQRWDGRLAVLAAEMESMEHRLQAGFERGIREAITSQTRTLVVSQLAAIVAIAGLAFGLGG